MAILKIKKYPDPILRKKCEEVKEITEKIKNLGWDMVETMIENQGIGLAAPQVGVLKRIIAVHLIQERTTEEKTAKSPQVFINPKILRKSKETVIEEEGCLSFPGLFLKIKRAREIEIESLNEKGEIFHLKAVGLPARVLQHEIDHLNGILIIDRVGFWQKLKINRQLKKNQPQ
jgi:peptide deformylase